MIDDALAIQQCYTQFDQVIERRKTHSNKWNKYPTDTIPMWVADMDFQAPTAIKTALAQRLEEDVFGYTSPSEQLATAIIKHLTKHYQWSVLAKDLIYLPGLVCALHLSVRAFSSEGDGIIVPSPVYYHLTKAAEFANREVLPVAMVLEENRWLPDFALLEAACARPNSKMLLLCNPHNPGGTVYQKAELERIQQLAQRYDLIVVSDEIHCDLLLNPEVSHTPFASINQDAADRTITLMAPSKTFNIAGLGFAFAVIENNALRQQFNHCQKGLIPSPNLFGLVAAQAAYEDCDIWHKALLEYLRDNRAVIQRRLKDTPLRLASLDATYLEWIDASALGLANPHAFFLKAGVAVSDGREFGNSQFLRLNFGCPRQLLDQALTRMIEAIDSHLIHA